MLPINKHVLTLPQHVAIIRIKNKHFPMQPDKPKATLDYHSMLLQPVCTIILES